MAILKGTGIYMHFTDVLPQYEEEFNTWYDTERLRDVLAVPGVLCGARYVACRGAPKYLAVYELANIDVAASPAFRKVEPEPADWGRRMLSSSITGDNVARVLAQQIFPPQLEMPDRPLPPALQIGRMSVPEQIDEAWNAWYNEEYIPDSRKVPGVLYARRYRVVEGLSRYMTVYEFEDETVPKSEAYANHRRHSSSSAEMRRATIQIPGSPGLYRRYTR